MVKRALRFAIGPSAGVVIGSLLFRVTNPHLYDVTWPSVAAQTGLYLVVGYVACFVVALLIEWVKAKMRGIE